MSDTFKNAGSNTPGGFPRWLNGLLSRACPHSTGIWTRLGLLVSILCAVKLAMLVMMRKQLFEEHWRVAAEYPNWINWVAFGVFAFLVTANLWKFGIHCQSAGKRAIHLANAFILFLGAVFIFLTFHSGEDSYLHLVMSRVLKWGNLASYLCLNFFFQWPFLMGWIFIYAVIYYGLVRTKRGHLILQITAVFAGAYIFFGIGDLKDYRNELITIDCLGLACLLTIVNRVRLDFRWLCLPWLSVILLFLLFRESAWQLSQPVPEFILICGCSVILFGGISLLAWRSGFFPVWTWLLPFGFFGFFLLVNTHYPPSDNYEKMLCLGLWLPRYFLGEFGLVIFLAFLGCVYRRFHPRGSLWWLDVMGIVLIALALVDLRLSQIIGVRLDCHVLSFGDSPKMMWRMAQPYLPSLFIGVVGIAAGYVIIFWLARRWRSTHGPRESTVHVGPGGIFIAIAFICLAVTGKYFVERDQAEGQTVFLLVQTSPLWGLAKSNVMGLDALTNTMEELGLRQPRQSEEKGITRERRDLNVVLIFQESTYNKYLSLFDGNDGTQPLLSQYKDRMELFPTFFSSFAGSIYARFATFTGLYPVRDFHAFTLKRVEVKSIFEALHDEGYSSSLFYSSFFDYTAFRDFLRGRELDEMYDADTMPGQRTTEPVTWGLREEETLGAIQARIKKYAADSQKFFLTYIPAAPHYPYDAIPDRFKKNKITEYGNYEPSYLNEMLYMDWVITSIVDELKTNGLLDKTLVVLTADHGEMLGINGGPIGHGWAVTPELANVPLIILDPENPGYRVNNTVGSEVDLFPTIMNRLGLNMPVNQLYQGVSLSGADSETNRLIYLNSLRQYAIIKDKRLVCGDRESGSRTQRKVFEMTNEAARTTFVEVPIDLSTNVPPISRFDTFQENFLQNYSKYCRMVWEDRSDAK